MIHAVQGSKPSRQANGKSESVEHRAHDTGHELQQAVQRLCGREEPQLFGRTGPDPWIARAEWRWQNNDLADFVRDYPT
jgi:hypothetical protein